MEKRTHFWTDPHLRKWVLQVIGLILLFALLGLMVWLFYDYQLKQMDRQKEQGGLLNAHSTTPAHKTRR